MRKGWMLAVLAIGVSGCIPNTDYGRGPDGYRPPRTDRHDRLRRTPTAPLPSPDRHARDSAPDDHRVATSTYVVRPGDTLRGIALATGTGAEAIGHANGLPLDAALPAGQRLTIPGGLYHRIDRGETGIAIAQAYGARWSDIVAANDLTEPYLLRAGRRLLIPGATATPPARDNAAGPDLGDLATGGDQPAVTEDNRPDSPRRVSAKGSKTRSRYV